MPVRPLTAGESAVTGMNIRLKLVVTMVGIAVLTGYTNWLASNTTLPTAARSLEGALVSRVACVVNIKNTGREQIEEIANGRLLVDTPNLFTRYKKSSSRITA